MCVCVREIPARKLSTLKSVFHSLQAEVEACEAKQKELEAHPCVARQFFAGCRAVWRWPFSYRCNPMYTKTSLYGNPEIVWALRVARRGCNISARIGVKSLLGGAGDIWKQPGTRPVSRIGVKSLLGVAGAILKQPNLSVMIGVKSLRRNLTCQPGLG